MKASFKIRHLVAVAIASSLATYALAGWPKHPELTRAFNAMENAEKALHEANDHEKSEFGGHRVKAEQLVGQAKEEVKQAVEWANSHH